MSRLGKRGEHLPFPKALEAEARRMADPEFRHQRESWHGNFYYFNRAQYLPQVQRYLEAFDRERVMIVLFEDMSRNPLETCRAAFAFLGVEPGFSLQLERYNVGREVRHRGMEKLLRRWAERFPFSGALGRRLHESLRRLNARGAPTIDAALAKDLRHRYRPGLERLSALIGRDLSHWME
jgi:hypothetical protein